MGRLIDADELNVIKEKLREFDRFINTTTRQYTDEHQAIYEHWIDCRYDIENAIDKLPTAYNKEKVVEEIKRKHCKKCRNILGAVGAEEYCKEQKCEIDELCDIVRKGGVE